MGVTQRLSAEVKGGSRRAQTTKARVGAASCERSPGPVVAVAPTAIRVAAPVHMADTQDATIVAGVTPSTLVLPRRGTGAGPKPGPVPHGVERAKEGEVGWDRRGGSGRQHWGRGVAARPGADAATPPRGAEGGPDGCHAPPVVVGRAQTPRTAPRSVRLSGLRGATRAQRPAAPAPSQTLTDRAADWGCERQAQQFRSMHHGGTFAPSASPVASATGAIRARSGRLHPEGESRDHHKRHDPD